MAEIAEASNDMQTPGPFSTLTDAENKKAAELIQRTYRGHRARRQIQGFGLDAETRWVETVKDAQFHDLTTPAPREDSSNATAKAKSRWNQATRIAQRAGADDVSISESEESHDEQDHQPSKDAEMVACRKKTAKMMDLQYFLEMVDQKHRYGSNLRKYHACWRTRHTQESFFYWLDFGDGKNIDVPGCTRKRLDTMQVRYLSREERQNYLARIDDSGLLVWAKNGERVWTKDELYKDSMQGIVPTHESTPKFQHNAKPEISSSSDDDPNDTDNSTAEDEGEQYVNEDFHRTKGPAKLKHVSAAVLFNHMIRKSLRKGHKWIFVADTSFRLYIGYKQSGAFQHSSFLHGSRILAAGLIKVNDGQLRSLSPLSGHYRPPAANFCTFVHSLKEAGADMSRVSISKSYAVLVGMESYTKGQKKVKAAEQVVTHEIDKVVRPEKAKQDELQDHDQSESAQKERAFLEEQRQQQNHDRKQTNPARRFSKRLTRLIHRLSGSGFDRGRRIAGTGPEDGIPPPEGKR